MFRVGSNHRKVGVGGFAGLGRLGTGFFLGKSWRVFEREGRVFWGKGLRF